MTTENVHSALSSIARHLRPTLDELLEELDKLEDAGQTLPKKAKDAYSAINMFLQEYAPSARIVEK